MSFCVLGEYSRLRKYLEKLPYPFSFLTKSKMFTTHIFYSRQVGMVKETVSCYCPFNVHNDLFRLKDQMARDMDRYSPEPARKPTTTNQQAGGGKPLADTLGTSKIIYSNFYKGTIKSLFAMLSQASKIFLLAAEELRPKGKGSVSSLKILAKWVIPFLLPSFPGGPCLVRRFETNQILSTHPSPTHTCLLVLSSFKALGTC
jgi:hypothetical protein